MTDARARSDGDLLAGRRALVTGAGRRVGRAIALALGSRAPIQVAESVVRRAGVDLGRLQSLADDAEEAPANPEPAPERPLHL